MLASPGSPLSAPGIVSIAETVFKLLNQFLKLAGFEPMELPPVPPADHSSEEFVNHRWQMPDPTPEEIAAACAEIRASWSEDEKKERVSGSAPDQFSGLEQSLLQANRPTCPSCGDAGDKLKLVTSRTSKVRPPNGPDSMVATYQCQCGIGFTYTVVSDSGRP